MLLFALAVSFYGAAAETVKKSEFEERHGLLVWDFGSVPGVVDDGDDLIDPSLTCAPATQPIKQTDRTPDLIRAIRRDGFALMKQLKLEPNLIQSTIVDSHMGHEKPVVILIPEKHLYASTAANHIQLHVAKTAELLAMVASFRRSGFRVLNAGEGPRGYWATTPAVQTMIQAVAKADRESRFSSAATWVNQLNLSGTDAIGELYAGEIPSTYVDTPGMNVRWVTGVFAYEAKLSPKPDYEAQFSEFKKFLASQGDPDGELIARYNLRKFYDDLVSKSPKAINKRVEYLCEERGTLMARNMFEDAQAAQADVVLMEFGLLHLHAIRQELLKRDYSHLVLSPNLSQ